MSAFFVRTAAERDLKSVSLLLGETWHSAYDAIYSAARVAEITASWHSLAALRPRLARPKSEFLVADDGSQIAGMAFAASGSGRLLVLHQLYVHPRFQGDGIGRELLSEIEGCFPEAETLRLEVESANLRAIRFYERNGFVAAGPGTGGTMFQGAPPEVSTKVYEKRLA